MRTTKTAKKKSDTIPASEFSDTFVQGMYDRMAVSFWKYGAVAKGFPAKKDAIGCLKQRLECYAEDGNTEHLIDLANYAMIEFMRPRHPKAHFKATDSSESPGRTNVDGTVDHRHNTEAQWKAPTPLDKLFK